MIILLALIPATMLTAAGYAVFYLAHRSEGNLKAFGRVLGFWAFTLAALLVLASFFLAGHCGRMHNRFMMPGQGWSMPWGNAPPGNQAAPPASGTQPAPVTPSSKPAS